MKKNKQLHFFRLTSLLLLSLLSACADLFEEQCPIKNQIDFVYRNENNRDETSLYLNRVTDYIFGPDSILHRVDSDIRGSRIGSRRIDLPDGNWYVLSFANLYSNSKVSACTVGKTHMRDLELEVISKDLLKRKALQYIGNSDNLYFSSVNLEMKGGRPKQRTVGYYTPAHIRLTAFVTWADKADQPEENGKLAAVLQGVSGGCKFRSEAKVDQAYNLPYAVPYPLSVEKSQRVQLYLSDDTFRFDAVSMRFETGKAPHLQLMNGTESLTKSLDLNRFFDANNIDLSNTRIQNIRISIRIEKHKIVISPIDILAWDVEYI